eukprot:jgi/Bigna1/81724/fgenesh1_pg.83_\
MADNTHVANNLDRREITIQEHKQCGFAILPEAKGADKPLQKVFDTENIPFRRPLSLPSKPAEGRANFVRVRQKTHCDVRLVSQMGEYGENTDTFSNSRIARTLPLSLRLFDPELRGGEMSTLGGEQLRNIIITNYVVSSFSLAGSLGIVASYIAFPQLRNFSYSLVLYLAISEAFYSVSNMLGNPPNASATCYVQIYTICALVYASVSAEAGLDSISSVMQSYFLLSAILWNAAIAYLLKNAILYPEKVLGITKSMPRYHAYCWGVPFILTVLPAATGSYGSSGAWCWIKSST